MAAAARRSPATPNIPPIAAACAPRARRWARRCRLRIVCCIRRSTGGGCRGTTALDTVADGFRQVIDRHGPDAVAFYVSGQLLTEDYYAANKLIKGFLGTANIDTNSRLCMASSVAGHKRAFGSDTVPGLYEDFELADLVVLVGSNLAWCHPVLFQRLEAAKRERPAMKIVVIDPRRTETCGIADLHLALRPGSDVALFNGLLAELQRRGAVATDFVDAPHQGLDAALAAAEASNVARVRSAGGRPCDLLRLVRANRADRHALLAGRQPIERRRRQGQRDHQLPSADRPHRPAGDGAVLDHRPAQRHGRPRSGRARQHARRAHGLRAGRRRSRPPLLARAAHRQQARSQGGRAVRRASAAARSRRSGSWRPTRSPACPTPMRCAPRSKACELSVVSEAVRASDTVDACRIRLPALAWAEKDGTVTNSERGISRQRPFLPSPGEARQDWRIIAGVAERLGFGQAFAWQSVADIFREHAALSAFENDGTRDFDIGAHAAIDDEAYRCACVVRLAKRRPLLRRWPLLSWRSPRTLRGHGSARAGSCTERGATASPEHRACARPVAHHDAHREIDAAGRPSA